MEILTLSPATTPPMYASSFSTQLGIPAAPESTETAHIAALIEILREVPTPFHFTHVSSARSVHLIAAAKADGLPITCDVTPHHLILNEEAYMGYDTQAKVCPPLRSEENRLALLGALKDGHIDAIASDHAPHTLVDKYVEFESAAVGMVGLETLFPLLYTKLVQEWKVISLPRLIELLTVNPARIMCEDVGQLAVGASADISIWDMDKTYKIDKSKFETKGRNTPFDGWQVVGQATDVFVDGEPVVRAGRLR